MSDRNCAPFPVLTTGRLTLRQLSIDDQQHIFALRSDPEINKYLNRKASKTVDDALDFIHRVNHNIENNEVVYWAITLTETGSFAGTICLFDFSSEKSSCEIGYELLKNFQGQGLMKEAAESVIAYTFQTLQCRNILACTHKDNQNSTKLLTKLRFVRSAETVEENPDLTIFSRTVSD